MNYLLNCWYQAAWSSEIDAGGVLVRTILDQPVLLWRSNTGQVAALLDRCPHRFAPLSAGTLAEDVITCGYHGLGFTADGRCLRNPHGPVTSSMRVRAFPVEERYGAVWIWPGDPTAAGSAAIPDLSFIDETPDPARITAILPTQANYQLIVDNILDLSHVDYIHPETLGGMMTGAVARCWAEGDRVISEWHAEDADTPLAYKPMVPEGRCDVRIKVAWQAPALLVLDNAVTPAGQMPGAKDHRLTLHNITPETATSSHYFVCSTRRFALDDAQVTEQLRNALLRAFVTEDKPMIEKQQARMSTPDLWSLDPMLLKIDAGAVRARRKLDAMIAAEQEHNDAERSSS